MHPAIADFPATAFYCGRLRSHPRPEDRPAPPGARAARVGKATRELRLRVPFW